MDEEIEVLPKVGEALSIKTRKQGRRAPMRDYKKKEVELVRSRDPHGTCKPKWARNNIRNLKTAELTAHNIIKHPRAFEWEKKLAKEFLEKPQEERKDYEYSKINNISMRLIKTGE